MVESKNFYPVLPLREIVVFPHMIVPLFVGREKSIKALDDVMETEEKHVLLVTQKDGSIDDPTADDLFVYGTLSKILQLLKLPDGTVKVLVEAVERVHIRHFHDKNDYFEGEGDIIETANEHTPDVEGLMRATIDQFEQYLKLNRKIPPDVLVTITQIDQPGRLADTIASYLTLKLSEKQELLEKGDVGERLSLILNVMESEISVLSVEKRIRTRVKKQMEKSQRDYYLNEQMKAIQKELGESEDGKDEISLLEDKIKAAKMPQEATDKCLAEVKKLRTMSPMAAEATVVRNYLDWMVGIPWNKRTRIRRNLKDAEAVLHRDHYGLEKVKERIMEYLAVQSRVGKVRGQILCLVGPPGVGKTSLGKSIAEATGRTFVRMALGGVRDEAEIRGHRRTYIGSMPGKIIQGMKKSKTCNPLFLLDEIDKLGADWRGDPSSALLEVLDPEQNTSFADHYLEVDYDLSDVMFVTTANSLQMPQPLLDRMEVIRLSGYTEDEKVEICKRHLVPKEIKLHGLKKGEFAITDDALRDLMRYYTREAGVRNLEREIANLCRKGIKDILFKKTQSLKITPRNLAKYAGVQRYRFGEAEHDHQIGVTTGLAWTEVGGDLLSIEAVVLPGKGKTQITGKLGDVMQESAQAALSYVRSKGEKWSIDPTLFEKKDLHIHVPEGATPKDGPSAGITICTSIVSALTNIPVRKEVAMTGEITLRGRVLPIGGLKEKLLAAHRGGITTVIIPKDNEKDLTEMPDVLRRGLTIIPVSTVDEVIQIALYKDIVEENNQVRPVTSPKGKKRKTEFPLSSTESTLQN